MGAAEPGRRERRRRRTAAVMRRATAALTARAANQQTPGRGVRLHVEDRRPRKISCAAHGAPAHANAPVRLRAVRRSRGCPGDAHAGCAQRSVGCGLHAYFGRLPPLADADAHPQASPQLEIRAHIRCAHRSRTSVSAKQAQTLPFQLLKRSCSRHAARARAPQKSVTYATASSTQKQVP